jgi:hypothetical protein
MLNFLSLMRILLNHDMKNSKNGITIFSDIGMVFQFSNDIHCGNDDKIHRILEYEKSVPTKYNDLRNSDLYRQKDYELYFSSNRQKAQLLDCYTRSILVIDDCGKNNNKKIRMTKLHYVHNQINFIKFAEERFLICTQFSVIDYIML